MRQRNPSESLDNCASVSSGSSVSTIFEGYTYARARRDGEESAKIPLNTLKKTETSKTPKTGGTIALENKGDKASQVSGSENRPVETVETALREVLSLPYRQLSALPLVTTLRLRVPGISAEVLFTTSSAQAARAAEGRVAVFGPARGKAPSELDLACFAAENDRARLPELQAWIRRKLADCRWRLTPGAALDGRVPGARVRGWTLGECLRRLGARCEAVSLGDDATPLWSAQSATEGQQAA